MILLWQKSKTDSLEVKMKAFQTWKYSFPGFKHIKLACSPQAQTNKYVHMCKSKLFKLML